MHSRPLTLTNLIERNPLQCITIAIAILVIIILIIYYCCNYTITTSEGEEPSKPEEEKVGIIYNFRLDRYRVLGHLDRSFF